MNKYYERWKAKKLAEDPDFFHHQYLRYVERYGQKRLNEMSTKWQPASNGQNSMQPQEKNK
jgi:hypothetical protein